MVVVLGHGLIPRQPVALAGHVGRVQNHFLAGEEPGQHFHQNFRSGRSRARILGPGLLGG